MSDHLLFVFNAVDVPESVSRAVMDLLNPYNPDTYVRPCDQYGNADRA